MFKSNEKLNVFWLFIVSCFIWCFFIIPVLPLGATTPPTPPPTTSPSPEPTSMPPCLECPPGGEGEEEESDISLKIQIFDGTTQNPKELLTQTVDIVIRDSNGNVVAEGSTNSGVFNYDENDEWLCENVNKSITIHVRSDGYEAITTNPFDLECGENDKDITIYPPE